MKSSFLGLVSITLPYGAGPGLPRVIIGSTLPADLVAFYAGLGLIPPAEAVAGLVLYPSATDDYVYAILVNYPAASGGARFCFGSRNSFGVAEAFAVTQAIGSRAGSFLIPGTGNTEVDNVVTSADWAFLDASITLSNNTPLFVDSKSFGRGLIGIETTTSTVNVASPGPGTLLGQGTKTYANGRAFRARLGCHVSSTVAGSLATIELTTGGGTVIADEQIFVGSNSECWEEYVFHFVNTSGADFATGISTRVTAISGGTFHMSARNANQPSYLITEDIGAATDWQAGAVDWPSL